MFDVYHTLGDYISVDNIYEDIQDIAALKKHMMDMLEEYNNTPSVVRMDLVLFRDAIEHSQYHLNHVKISLVVDIMYSTA